MQPALNPRPVLPHFSFFLLSMTVDPKFAFQVPTVAPTNADDAVTLQMCFDALDHLGRVTDNVMGRIAARCEQERVRLAHLNGRVVAAAEKTRLVAASSKATTVFATASFPRGALSRGAAAPPRPRPRGRDAPPPAPSRRRR